MEDAIEKPLTAKDRQRMRHDAVRAALAEEHRRRPHIPFTIAEFDEIAARTKQAFDIEHPPIAPRRKFDAVPGCAEALAKAWAEGGQRIWAREIVTLVPMLLQELNEPVVATQIIDMLGITSLGMCRRAFAVLGYHAHEALSEYCREEPWAKREGDDNFVRFWSIKGGA